MLLRLMNIKARGSTILMKARDEKHVKHSIVVEDFKPYFYRKEILQNKHVEKIERGYKSLFGENLYKIVVDHPGIVPKLRKKGDHESDILYPTRFLVDTGLSDYFEVPDEKVEEGKEMHISYKDIKPIKMEEA